MAVVPGVEGVVEHRDARGGLGARIRVLAEDDNLPPLRRMGLQRLESQLPDGDDVRTAVRADERRRLRQRLDDRLQQRQPRLAATREELGEGQRVVRVGRRRGRLAHRVLPAGLGMVAAKDRARL